MTENFSERIENALNDIQKIQTMFRLKYGKECLADKEIEEVLKIAKAEHEEIQQYRAIGTVEECREARERQKGKRPIFVHPLQFDDFGDYMCSTCKTGTVLNAYGEKSNNCPYCGQNLDWSEYK